MTVKFAGFVMLKSICPPFYSGFIHNGTIVVFSSVTSVSGVCEVSDVALQIKKKKNHRCGHKNEGSGMRKAV